MSSLLDIFKRSHIIDIPTRNGLMDYDKYIRSLVERVTELENKIKGNQK